MARKLTPEEQHTPSDVVSWRKGSDPEHEVNPEDVGQLREKTPLKLSSELEVWFGDLLGNRPYSV